MNAGAYGRDWSDVVARALVATADGADWLTLDQLASRTGTRRSARERWSHGSSYGSIRGRARTSRRQSPSWSRSGKRPSRPTSGRSEASSRIRPAELGAGRMLELCGLKGHRIGGAVISPKHANFIENADGATSADCVALMVEARRRAREQFGVSSSARSPSSASSNSTALVTVTRCHVGGTPAAANPAPWPGDGPSADRVGARARQASSSRFRAAKTGDRLDLARLVPSGRSLLIAFALVVAVLGAYWGATASSVFAVEHLEVKARLRRSCARSKSPRRTSSARVCSRSTHARSRTRCARSPRWRASRSTEPSPTRSSSRLPPSGPLRSSDAGARRGSRPGRGR